MTIFCLWVDIHDLITYATFGDDRLRGLDVARGRISRLPIDLRCRPYKTRTTVRVCDHSIMIILIISVFAILLPMSSKIR